MESENCRRRNDQCGHSCNVTRNEVSNGFGEGMPARRPLVYSVVIASAVIGVALATGLIERDSKHSPVELEQQFLAHTGGLNIHRCLAQNFLHVVLFL